MTILPLSQIIEIIYKHIQEKGNGLADVRFNHRVVAIGQDEDKGWVDVEIGEEGTATEKARYEADYVVGCDGGRSAVRHALFGRDWPGLTHDCHLLVQNVSVTVLNRDLVLTPLRSGMTASRSMAGMVEIICWTLSTLRYLPEERSEVCGE